MRRMRQECSSHSYYSRYCEHVEALCLTCGVRLHRRLRLSLRRQLLESLPLLRVLPLRQQVPANQGKIREDPRAEHQRDREKQVESNAIAQPCQRESDHDVRNEAADEDLV